MPSLTGINIYCSADVAALRSSCHSDRKLIGLSLRRAAGWSGRAKQGLSYTYWTARPVPPTAAPARACRPVTASTTARLSLA
jgi:hypothetical protein